MSDKEVSNWYIFHISYRQEKKVEDVLTIAGIENYIPFQTIERAWKSIVKELQVPVIQGIGFARVSEFDLGMLKMMKEISLLLDANDNLVTISDEQMETIKSNPSSLIDYMTHL